MSMNKDALLAMPKLLATAHLRNAAKDNMPLLKRWEQNYRVCDQEKDRPYQEHKAAEPTLEPRRTIVFSSYNSKKRCNFVTAHYYRRLITKNLKWAIERGFSNVLVDYTTPYGLLALETLLPIKTNGTRFNLYAVKSLLFSERKSYRLVPETNIEIAFLTRECDYSFSQYLPEETLFQIFNNAGVLCSESGIAINSRWIPQHLIDVW